MCFEWHALELRDKLVRVKFPMYNIMNYVPERWEGYELVKPNLALFVGHLVTKSSHGA